MRCNNCGWDNPQGASRCEKCNSVLTSPHEAERPAYTPAPQPASSPTPAGATARGGHVEEPFIDRPAQVNYGAGAPDSASVAGGEGLIRCERCHYPLMPGALFCPNCGCKQQATPAAAQSAQQPAQQQPVPQPAEAPRRKTVDIYTALPTHRCTLKPLSKNGEKETLPPVAFTDTTPLNRDNTEPANNSITGQEQAHLELRDGHWFITDHSALKSTFIRCEGEVELHKGDIVMMGDRKFLIDIE